MTGCGTNRSSRLRARGLPAGHGYSATISSICKAPIYKSLPAVLHWLDPVAVHARSRGRWARSGATWIVIGGLVSCTSATSGAAGGGDVGKSRIPAPVPAAINDSGTAPSVSADGDRRDRVSTRACGSGIFGEPHDPSAWKSRDTVGGLIAFLGIMEEAPEIAADQLRPDEQGRLEAHKFVAVVNGSAVGPVSVSIAVEDRARAVLVYDPETWLDQTLAGGDYEVKFEVCPGKDTQHNGGFRLNTPGCVEVAVKDEGEGSAPARATIPFGVSECADKN